MLNATANILFGFTILAMAFAITAWLIQRPLFTFRSIRIEAAQTPLRHISVSTIKSAAIPYIKGNFFTANLEMVKAAFETVPWVRRATIRRKWPDQLIIMLEEHIPLGTWGNEGRLISTKGDLFTVNLAEAEEVTDLFDFNGPNGSEKEVLTLFSKLRGWLQPVHLLPQTISLSSRYACTVKLSNGLILKLGRELTGTTLKERAEKFSTVYPQLLKQSSVEIESIDMRYPNGLAVKTKSPAPTLKKIKAK